MLSMTIKTSEKEVKKQKDEGINETQIYKEAYDFLLNELKTEELSQTIKLNKQVAEGIENLTKRRQWTNLLSISKHAIENCLKCVKEDKFIIENKMEYVLEFKSFILNSGKNEFINYLTPKAKEKFFPNKIKKGEIK